MQLFRFANPEYLYLLLLLPVLIVLFIINQVRRRNSLKKLGESAVIDRLLPEISRIRPVIKFIFSATWYFSSYYNACQAPVRFQAGGSKKAGS